MRRDVFLGGRGLACALGSDLATSLDTLRHGGIAPQAMEAAPGQCWPYFSIADSAANTEDWYGRARRLVCRVVAECGAGGSIDRHAPLYLASSSLNVGALENGAPYLADCQVFVEEVARWLDWQGEVLWVSTACTSALNALRSAQRRIRAGDIDSALILGLELKNRFSVAGFGGMQLLDARGVRPLAADRGGLVLGEAVAALQVTAEPQRWRVAGCANLVDGSDPAGASQRAVAAMLRQAMADAGLATAAIDLVKLQAAGSPHNDAVEIAGLREAFATLPPLTTLKQAIGHTLGAAAAAELVLLTALLEAGTWAPSIDAMPDPAIGATLSPEVPPRVRHVLATILGFGGGHAAAILEDTTVANA